MSKQSISALSASIEKESAAASAATLAGIATTAARTLYTYGQTVFGTAGYFQSFTKIAVNESDDTSSVDLALTAPGSLNLSSQLGSRGVCFTGSASSDAITTGAGNDTIEGGGGSDILKGGAGRDWIIDESGASTTIDAGTGDDMIRIGGGMTGTVNGGEGTDTLHLFYARDLGSVVFTSVEALSFVVLRATAAQLESFTTIAGYESEGIGPTLVLAKAGTVNLADELGTNRVKFEGTSGIDSITTGKGSDTISGLGGSDTLMGGDGNDELYGAQFDPLVPDTGNDSLVGGRGNDLLTDLGGKLAISAGDDDDQILIGNAMSGVIDGGTGIDQLRISPAMLAPSATASSLGSLTIGNVENLFTDGITVFGTAAQFESFSTIRSRLDNSVAEPVNLALLQVGNVDLTDELKGRSATITGSLGNDGITSSDGADTLRGGSGNDFLGGGGGDDALFGDVGNDEFDGGAGNDTISDAEGDFIVARGGAGSDKFLLIGGLSGSVDGGADADTFYAGAPDALGDLKISNVENLFTNGFNIIGTAAQFESFTTISRTASSLGSRVYLTLSEGGRVDLAGEIAGRAVTFTGSLDDDGITTGAGADTIDGRYGNDAINAGSGNDSLYGGDDDDTLTGGAGADKLSGGAGFDIASYANSAAGVTIDLAARTGLGGDAQGDTFSGIEGITGSALGDRLLGDGVANRLSGGVGSDTLNGKGGADVISTGTGSDIVQFTAALGPNNIDAISDFSATSDSILLAKAVFKTLKSGATADALSTTAFRKTGAPSTSAGLGEIIYNATTGGLLYDADGSGTGAAVQFAQLSTGLALSAANFKLA